MTGLKNFFIGMFCFVFLGWAYPLCFFAIFVNDRGGNPYVGKSMDDGIGLFAELSLGLCWWAIVLHSTGVLK